MAGNKYGLCGSVALSVLFLGQPGYAYAQAPSNEQLYKMLLELKGEQDRLRRENTQVRHEADQARAEVTRLRKQLAETDARVATKVVPTRPPAPDSRTAPYGTLAAVSTTNVGLEMAGSRTADGRAGGLVSGSLAVPLPANLGFQTNAAVGGRSSSAR